MFRTPSTAAGPRPTGGALEARGSALQTGAPPPLRTLASVSEGSHPRPGRGDTEIMDPRLTFCLCFFVFFTGFNQTFENPRKIGNQPSCRRALCCQSCCRTPSIWTFPGPLWEGSEVSPPYELGTSHHHLLAACTARQEWVHASRPPRMSCATG